jgi:hypothetical protein
MEEISEAIPFLHQINRQIDHDAEPRQLRRLHG